jgi:hypothetical protein
MLQQFTPLPSLAAKLVIADEGSCAPFILPAPEEDDLRDMEDPLFSSGPTYISLHFLHLTSRLFMHFDLSFCTIRGCMGGTMGDRFPKECRIGGSF